MTAATTNSGLAEVPSPTPRPVWQRIYGKDSKALLTQSPAWINAMKAAGRWQETSRLYRFEDGRELVLPLVQRRGAVAQASSMYSMPGAWGYSGLADSGITAGAVREGVQNLIALRSGQIRVRPNPLHPGAWHEGSLDSESGVFEVARRAHVLALGDDPDEMFRTSFTSACGRAVRSAEKAGLTVESDSDGHLVPVFHRLLLSSVERWAGSQHEPLALAPWRAGRRDPPAKFQAWSRSRRRLPCARCAPARTPFGGNDRAAGSGRPHDAQCDGS